MIPVSSLVGAGSVHADIEIPPPVDHHVVEDATPRTSNHLRTRRGPRACWWCPCPNERGAHPASSRPRAIRRGGTRDRTATRSRCPQDRLDRSVGRTGHDYCSRTCPTTRVARRAERGPSGKTRPSARRLWWQGHENPPLDDESGESPGDRRLSSRAASQSSDRALCIVTGSLAALHPTVNGQRRKRQGFFGSG